MKPYMGAAILCSTYLLTILLGLNNAAILLPQMYPPPGQKETITPMFENPDSMWSSAQLIIYLFASTVVMLILIKKGWSLPIKAAILLSFLIGTMMTLTNILDVWGIIPAVAVVAWAFWKKGVAITNLVLMLTIAGVGAILGASLGFLPALALILVMSVYDIIAVFGTKHMVTIARESVGKYPLMFTIPTADKAMGLGAGDIAIPLTFSASVLASHGMGYALTTAYGGLLGLTALYYYMLGKRDVTLPALPPITAGLLIGYCLCAIIVG